MNSKTKFTVVLVYSMAKDTLRVFYPASGLDFWRDSPDKYLCMGSFDEIKMCLHGKGRITKIKPQLVDIVFCDNSPNIGINDIRPLVDRLFNSKGNNLDTAPIIKYYSNVHFSKIPPSDWNFTWEHEWVDGPSEIEWKNNSWMYEVCGIGINDVMIRFRYYATSYQQTMHYLYSIGWKLRDNDTILLGSGWEDYGEGGQNLKVIFEQPLNKFFHENTIVLDKFTKRTHSQGMWR
jgi:hypothetical protein